MSSVGKRGRVYVPGTFDCLHVGHLNLLEVAATLGEVWVGLNTDDFAERYKRRPVYSLVDRLRIIEALKTVDEVVVNFGDEDSSLIIEEVNPNIILHGDDWTGQEYLDQLGVSAEWLADRGIELRYPRYTPGVSTTQIIETLETNLSRLTGLDYRLNQRDEDVVAVKNALIESGKWGDRRSLEQAMDADRSFDRILGRDELGGTFNDDQPLGGTFT
jgi:cytidyltransferase-like protein